MKSKIILLSFFFFAIGSLFIQLSAQSFDDKLTEIKNFGTNPGNLKMMIFENIEEKTQRHPVVIALHGCSQKADDFAQISGWNKIANNNQFYMLYPQQKTINNFTSCFNWFLKDDIEGKDGESFSIFEMITYMKRNYPIDTTQIFITGVSAGGAMSVVLMANYPSIFNTGAIYAGCAYGIANSLSDGFKIMNGTKKATLKELSRFVTNLHKSDSTVVYPKIIILQGEDDKVVHPKNAELLKNQWCKIHQLDTAATYTSTHPLDSNITKYQYVNTKGEPIVTLYKIAELGHKLLISPGEEPFKGGKMGMFAKRSNFHNTYQIALDFNLITK